MTADAPALLAQCNVLVAQHSTFVMDKPEIKSVFYDQQFIQAPLIKWIAARERLAAFSGAADNGQLVQRFFQWCQWMN